MLKFCAKQSLRFSSFRDCGKCVIGEFLFWQNTRRKECLYLTTVTNIVKRIRSLVIHTHLGLQYGPESRSLDGKVRENREYRTQREKLR